MQTEDPEAYAKAVVGVAMNQMDSLGRQGVGNYQILRQEQTRQATNRIAATGYLQPVAESIYFVYNVFAYTVKEHEDVLDYVFAYRYDASNDKMDFKKFSTQYIPREYMYFATGTSPIPSNVIQSQGTGHLRQPRAASQQLVKTGVADLNQLVKAIVDSELQGHLSENRMVTTERQVSDGELTKVAQQLSSQGVMVAQLVGQTRAENFRALNMIQHFGNQSRDAQWMLVDRLTAKMAEMQESHESALTAAYTTFVAATERQNAQNLERERRMHAAHTQASAVASNASAAVQSQLVAQISRASDQANQRAREAEQQNAQTITALNTTLRNVMAPRSQPRESVSRSPAPQRRVTKTEPTVKPGAAPSPRRGPAPPLLSFQVTEPGGRAEGLPMPPLERMVTGAVGTGGMGVALLAGAAVVAIAVANS